MHVWHSSPLIVSFKHNHITSHPLTCYAYVNSSTFLPNICSTIISPKEYLGFPIIITHTCTWKPIFGDEDVTILPLFNEFCPQNSSTCILKQNTDILILIFIFYSSRCFLNIIISPNNLNHRKFMFSKLFNFIIHNIYRFVNHQIFYTFHL